MIGAARNVILKCPSAFSAPVSVPHIRNHFNKSYGFALALFTRTIKVAAKRYLAHSFRHPKDSGNTHAVLFIWDA